MHQSSIVKCPKTAPNFKNDHFWNFSKVPKMCVLHSNFIEILNFGVLGVKIGRFSALHILCYLGNIGNLRSTILRNLNYRTLTSIFMIYDYDGSKWPEGAPWIPMRLIWLFLLFHSWTKYYFPLFWLWKIKKEESVRLVSKVIQACPFWSFEVTIRSKVTHFFSK